MKQYFFKLTQLNGGFLLKQMPVAGDLLGKGMLKTSPVNKVQVRKDVLIHLGSISCCTLKTVVGGMGSEVEGRRLPPSTSQGLTFLRMEMETPWVEIPFRDVFLPSTTQPPCPAHRLFFHTALPAPAPCRSRSSCLRHLCACSSGFTCVLLLCLSPLHWCSSWC